MKPTRFITILSTGDVRALISLATVVLSWILMFVICASD